MKAHETAQGSCQVRRKLPGGARTPGSLFRLVQPYHPCVRGARVLPMSRFFKSAAFPILIVIVLAFFASKLIARSDQAPAKTFNGFLEQIDRGQIQTVTLRTKDNSAEVTLRGADKSRYEVGYPLDYSDVLVNKLRQATA